MKLIPGVESAFLASLQVLEDTNLPVTVSKDVVSMLASALVPAVSHPFWLFDWSQLWHAQVLICSVALFLAGLLCSAGGIGGGGIYVTVLMVAGRLSPRDAVPLSKAIVFFGSLSSLVLNMRRQLAGSDSGPPKTLIDPSICRLVVPSALAGTLMGVLLNRSAPDSVIILLLSTILVSMTVMVSWTAWSQYLEEKPKLADAQMKPDPFAPLTADPVEEPAAGGSCGAEAPPSCQGASGPAAVDAVADLDTVASKAQAQPQRREYFLSCLMLMIVVVSGVARFHAGACWEELQLGEESYERLLYHKACHHPAISIVGESLERWMRQPAAAGAVMQLTLIVPMGVCLMVMLHSGWNCVMRERWSKTNVVKYEIMGLLTGCLAGLVGIGGGLIFSPFFLIMGVEPSVAVATSSTCVIFTSSSTTLQYLLTDRIIMSLTVAYGLVNLVASYGGTAFVHFLSDRFGTRRSYITGIVALGVAISAALSLVKLPVA